jgi:hypothetical protein
MREMESGMEKLLDDAARIDHEPPAKPGAHSAKRLATSRGESPA